MPQRHLRAVPNQDAAANPPQTPATPPRELPKVTSQLMVETLSELGLNSDLTFGLVIHSNGLLLTTREVLAAPAVTTKFSPEGDIYTYRIPWTQEAHQ